MSELPRLPERLVRFIRSSLPDYPSAVLLVKLARAPERRYSLAELAEPAGPAAESYLDRFDELGLLEREENGLVRYRADSEHADAVADLVAAYDERPVTLIRLIDRHALGSFVEAFRLRKEDHGN